ncbi:CinA family protein [Pajaroellobacter abortibovis]|uniref:CinA C-terminal domain-containing protein n=1 Tax=Pajaroellobacter abortibovis TaxID=1882918 RepID=A0A1L6MUU0_9BACT|nr:CinA family protein [Pajaroellobacter abortibovis]APR99256.1 hypothetical protein BCY86_00135 [Pajaroellobacter abortibovis]
MAVAYTHAKMTVLGVERDRLERFTAVSPEITLEIAKKVKRITCSDLALAITGVAGPSGGDWEKPVGTVLIALTLIGMVR